MNFKELIAQLHEVNLHMQQNAIRAVNTSLTLRNWFFGFYILEFEQNGTGRAAYGKRLLARIAEELLPLNIPNTNERELRRFRQFYMVYPTAFSFILQQFSIRGLVFPESIIQALQSIRESSSPDLPIPASHFEKIFVSKYLVELPNKAELENFILEKLN